MSLESSRHGWEGISNNGEIYGGYNSLSDEMMSQADEINAMLDKINLEDIQLPSKDEEYLKIVKSLALKKLKNDILFEEMLRTSISRLSNLGIVISREQLMDDIQKEISKQVADLRISETVENKGEENVVSQIDYLKNNLGQIFDGSFHTENKQQPQSYGSIPREPAMGYQEKMANVPNVANTEAYIERKQGVLEELDQAKKAMTQQLETSVNHPNEPTVVNLGNRAPFNIWDDLNGIDKNSNEFYAKFDDIYEIQVERLGILKATNSPEFETKLQEAVSNIMSKTDKIPNIKEQLLHDIEHYVSISYVNTNSQDNSKENLITDIIKLMYPSGVEFVPINDIKKKLELYSVEQLEAIKSQYIVPVEETQEERRVR